MRWVFLSLLSLNAVVFLVQWLELQKRHSASIRTPKYQFAENAGTLMLLSEIKLLPNQNNAPKQAEREGGLVAVEDSLCFLIGPVADEVGAIGLQQQLLEVQAKTRVHVNRLALAPEYWVYLAPLDSRKAAIVRLKELQVRKIDSYLIAQGELRNGISLGLFRNIDSAMRMQEQRKQQGFEALIREVPKEKVEYWLVSEEEANMQLMGRIDSVLGGQEGAVEARQIFCKSVASESELP